MKAHLDYVMESGTIKFMTVNPDKKTETGKLILTILRSWKQGVWMYNEEINTIIFTPTLNGEKTDGKTT